jgi:chitinase
MNIGMRLHQLNRLMKRYALRVLLLALSASLTAAAPAQAKDQWITAYYPWWFYYQMPPSAVDFSAMTHVVVFSSNPTKTAPYLDVLVNPHDSANVVNGLDCGIPGDYLRQLVTLAHAKGTKVLLSVGGIWGVGSQNMSYIAQDDKRIEIFVTASCAFAKRWGFDGLELDWEVPQLNEKWRHNKLILRFRAELDRWNPRGLFVAATWESPLPVYDRDAMVAAFDQINPMTYEMYKGDFTKTLTGYNGPIEQSTQFVPYAGAAINQPGHGPRAWIAQGYPASKLGLSISFTTTVFTNVGPPVQPSRLYGGHDWGNVRDIPKRGRHWDASSGVPWQASGSTFISYEDTASCRLKVEYGKSLGLGGVMVYELGGGYIPKAPPGERDLLIKSIANAVRYSGRPIGDCSARTAADKEAPKISFIKPKAKERVSGTITLKAAVTDNVGVAGVQYFIDGKKYGSIFDDASQTPPPLNTWRLANGEHASTVEATDESNNVSQARVVFTVNNRGTAPRFQDIVVYDDMLQPPFSDVSWAVVNDFHNRDVVKSGAASLKVVYADYGAVWLQNGKYGEEKNILPGEYEALTFDAYPSEDVELEIIFSNGYEAKVQARANQWNALRVPLNCTDPFKNFYVRRNRTGRATVYFDNILLKAVPAMSAGAGGK